LVILLVAVAGILFLSANIFTVPPVQQVSFSRGDAAAAQGKLYEVVLRDSGRSSRQDPLAITDREATAFLSRYLKESAGLPMSPLIVRFSHGRISVQGQTALRNLFQGPPFAQLLPFIPDRRLDQPVWVTLRGRLAVEPALGGSTSRHVKVEVSELSLGRQPISPGLLYAMMGPTGAALLRWPVPSVVESVDLQDGQAVIRTR
jgi:hypothetical protein